MKTNNEEIVLTIIQSDLLHQHLLNGLSNMGVDAYEYSLDLQDVAFDLLGIEPQQQNDKLYDHHFQLCKSPVKRRDKPSMQRLRTSSRLLLEKLKHFQTTENRRKWMKKAQFPKRKLGSNIVGMRGFEPPISGPPDQHFNRTKLHPETNSFREIQI